MAAAAPLFKAYRVAIVFGKTNQWEKVDLTDQQLMKYVAWVVLGQLLICTAYAFYHQWYGGVERVYVTNYNRIEWTCNRNPTVCVFGSVTSVSISDLVRFQ